VLALENMHLVNVLIVPKDIDTAKISLRTTEVVLKTNYFNVDFLLFDF